MNDNTKTPCADDWQPCEGGELRQVVSRVKTERRNREAVRIGGVAVILVLCAFAATLVWQQTNRAGHDYGGITCKEVQLHLPDYKKGNIGDQRLVKSMRVHLAECPHCGPLYEKMSQPGAVSQVAGPSHIARRCDCCTHSEPGDSRADALLAAAPSQ